MTRKEACDLELLVDKKFSNALEEDCKCSLTLANTFRITFDDNAICMKINYGPRTINVAVSWIQFDGFYDDLKFYIRKSLLCIEENSEMIKRLLWSYEHISELED